jgi:hypothetical protein
MMMQTTPRSPGRKCRRFAGRMTKALRKCGATGPINYDVDGFRLTIGPDPTTALEVFLESAYDSYLDAALAERVSVLRRHAAPLVELGRPTPAPWADAWRHLLPRVRARHFFAQPLPAGLAADGPDEGHRAIGEHLGVGLAYVMPTANRGLGSEALADWGVAWDDAFAVACDNLRKLTRRPFVSPTKGVYVSPSTDTYGPSLLVLTDLIRDLDVKGEPVAIAPDHETLIVTGSKDQAGLRAMLNLAEDLYAPPRLLSGFTIRLRNGKWEPFEPDAAFPGLAGFAHLRVITLFAAYARQFAKLKASLADRGEDMSVGHYLPWDARYGSPASVTYWCHDRPALLPRADAVVFTRELPGGGNSQVVAAAKWDRVQSVVGDLMTAVGCYPERFRVDGFPSAEQLQELGFAAGFEGMAPKN